MTFDEIVKGGGIPIGTLNVVTSGTGGTSIFSRPFEYYVDLIRNGEELTPIENSNAKKLFRRGYADSLEKGKAIVRRNRDLKDGWNDWFYNRHARTPDEEVETEDT